MDSEIENQIRKCEARLYTAMSASDVSERVQMEKDGHAASSVRISEVTIGGSFGAMPEVRIL
jgi:hypothetical protein